MSVDIAILFRYQKPSGSDETLLATANTYLVSRPGLALTAGDTVDFKRLRGLPLSGVDQGGQQGLPAGEHRREALRSDRA